MYISCIEVFIFVLLYIRISSMVGQLNYSEISFIAYVVNTLYEPIFVIVLYTFHPIDLLISNRMFTQFNVSIDSILEFLFRKLHRYFICSILKSFIDYSHTFGRFCCLSNSFSLAHRHRRCGRSILLKEGTSVGIQHHRSGSERSYSIRAIVFYYIDCN